MNCFGLKHEPFSPQNIATPEPKAKVAGVSRPSDPFGVKSPRDIAGSPRRNAFNMHRLSMGELKPIRDTIPLSTMTPGSKAANCHSPVPPQSSAEIEEMEKQEAELAKKCAQAYL